MSGQTWTIVVGVDFSEGSEVAVHHAIGLARHLGAPVTMAHVATIPEPVEGIDEPPGWDELAREQRAGARSALAALAARHRAADLRLTDAFVEGKPWEVLPTLASGAPGILVVGAHGRSAIERLLIGSVAERVMRHASIPVLVARGAAPGGGYRNILVPVELDRSVDEQVDIAREVGTPGANIHLFHAWKLPILYGYEPIAAFTSLGEKRRSAVERAGEALVRRHGGPRRPLTFSHRDCPPVPAILDLIDAGGHDLVVLGRGRKGVGRGPLGAVAERVTRHAPCSVLVV